MTTVTGTVLDAAGRPARVKISFRTATTPSALATNEIILNSVVVTATSAEDGTYSVQLEPGDYIVNYSQSPFTLSTSLRITVPTGDDSFDIAELVTSLTVLPTGTVACIFMATGDTPTLPPEDQSVATLLYTRSRNLFGWDPINLVWLPFIT